MEGLIIRNFRPADVDDFIRLSNISFAEESIAAGLTPEDFEQETRRIFRWKMIPYKLLTALTGLRWEGFVAERDGKVVGGGMYMGRDDRMVLSNLMVDPEYRRQGIGQALLKKRLERLAELGFPFVTTEVLETNTASLANLRKQDFELFSQYSVYEHSLPIPEIAPPGPSPLELGEVSRSDKLLFIEIEKKYTPPLTLHIQGSSEHRYFLSPWQKSYLRFAHYCIWIKVCRAGGQTVGFVRVDFQEEQRKGFMLQPILTSESLPYLPAILKAAGDWLASSGRESMVVEIPDQGTMIRDYLLEHGWVKKYTWLEYIKWLEDRARQEALKHFLIQTS